MSELGDLLELIHGAPLRYMTLEAEVLELRGRSKSRTRVSLPVPEPKNDHSATYLKRSKWRRRPPRRPPWWMRFELPRKSVRAVRPELWDPALLLTNYWLEPLGSTEHRGRPAIRARLTDRDSADDYARLAHRGEYEILVDAELGILLRAERIDGAHRAVWAIGALEFERWSEPDGDARPAPSGTGEILALLYTAKRRFTTLHAELATGNDRQGTPFGHAEVWFHSRWRWRCEMDTPDGRQVEVANDRRYWHGIPPHIHSRQAGEDDFRTWYEVPFEEHWDGALLVPGLWLEVLGEEQLGHASVIRAHGTPRPHDEYWDPSFWNELNDVELLIDADLGVVRRLTVHKSWFDATEELVGLELDPRLSDDLFEYRGELS